MDRFVVTIVLAAVALCAHPTQVKADLMQSLIIGTDVWGSQVFANGAVAAAFSPSNWNTATFQHYDSDWPVFQVYMRMRQPAQPDDPVLLSYKFQSYQADDPTLLGIYARAMGTELRTADLPELTVFQFLCQGSSSGTTTVRLQLLVNATFQSSTRLPVTASLSIAFNKTCGGSQFNQYLNVGTRPGTANIVRDGLYTNSIIVTTAVPSEYFYIWLESFAPRQEVFSIGAGGIVFANGVFMNPNATFISNSADPAQNSTKPAVLQIEYNCNLVGAAGVAELSFLSLALVSGAPGDPPYNAVSFTWAHLCPATPSPPPIPWLPDHSSSTLSEGEITAIVVCVLLVAFYVCGCAYNYVAKGARGWYILPGVADCLRLSQRGSTSGADTRSSIPSTTPDERTPFALSDSSTL